MPVSEPGFEGGDRTSIDIPPPEEALVRAVAATGKPLVVVLMNGSALAARWEKEHANAVLESWYSGEEGGRAIANTLSGANNPAGRLPVTFYAGVEQLPKFEDYAMKGRTYRYFSGNTAVAVRIRAQLHELQLRRPNRPAEHPRRPAAPRLRRRHEQRKGRGRRGGAALPDLPGHAGSADPRTPRVPARPPCSGRQRDCYVRPAAARPQHGQPVRRHLGIGRQIRAVDRRRATGNGCSNAERRLLGRRPPEAAGVTR